ncbi:MAG: hypothetical protein A2508_02885 [Candidatus Lambdaproteobacteria bacterium RIFOXYD12_FULL_49_8]|uniref:Uncharacterized protein n=1 Tax=Candidatus Lambdaproteobacteria bacterium RIFOXYD2_FULL_50_16 TaxID=1817772 RepID=A0A1F6G7R2_9PROT|nr:MAG: hypothetical protein A2527_09870 [Candidatus Lambdaproteobacteria bacterium RIFOXYD2_FULL_50_16]OGG96565.1 MAG: hypothetical protein A2508_02885 [Candidatus Lambdaproteobacteria bacterium RIFOXYD12_FULL_49_8]
MYKTSLKRLLLVVCLLFLLNGEAGFSQTDKKEGPEPQPPKMINVYTTWMKLAMLGKNQAEIESYFMEKISARELDDLKQRIRDTVLDNLKRTGLAYRIHNSDDLDDINVVVDRVLVEIRYAGLEHDQDLKLSIKEEFGIPLERL